MSAQHDMFAPDPTVRSARATLQSEAGKPEGTICPVCDRFTKYYKRRLNSTMARSLLWLVVKAGPGRGWIYVPSVAPIRILRSNELPKCKHWKLCEPQPQEPNSDQKCSGVWRPTDHGVAFARRQIPIRKYAILYNDTCLGFEGDDFYIDEALGSGGFNYRELMRSMPTWWS
jgi:hypothetical protein